MAGEFYGRSYDLNGGRNVDGSPLDSIWNLYLHYDGKSETITAGESFTAGAFAAPYRDLEGIDELEISWVIECGPSSNGTLELFSGLDPMGRQDPNRATENIGTAHVDGQQTVALRTASITVADLYRLEDEAIVWVKCTSGSVELVQVKLRAWPLGGARGAWSRTPAVQRGGSAVAAYSAAAEVSSATTTSEVYWDDQMSPEVALEAARTEAIARAQSAMAAAAGQTMRYDVSHPNQMLVSGTAIVRADVAVFNATLAHGYRSASSQAEAPGYLRANYEDTSPPLPEGAGVDPREIQFEPMAQARAVGGGGPVHSAFGGWTGALRFTYGSGVQPSDLPIGPAVLHQHTLGDLDFLIPRPGGTTFDVTYGHRAGGSQAALAPGDGVATSIEVPLTGGPILALTVTVPGFLEGDLTSQAGPIEYTVANTGRPGLKINTTGFAGLDPARSTFTYIVAFPEFEYFDPDLPWVDEDEPTPRFFWKDGLDNWRAIGPGKPADDLVLFKIKTAMGIYREPRPGEESIQGHPAKVKISEGHGADAWDTVVWMTPHD